MVEKRIHQIYEKLLFSYGPQRWWPTATNNKTFEIIIGAILTQNTAWKNVEKAIANLKENNLISIEAIKKINSDRLAKLITPAGCYNQKAERLKITAGFFDANRNFGEANDVNAMRSSLLNIKGIGPETADSILLYAFEKPSFVVDAYTKRIFSRIGLCNENIEYNELQKMFHANLEPNPKMFNEYHALIVEHAKQYCTKKPSCSSCFLKKLCKGNI